MSFTVQFRNRDFNDFVLPDGLIFEPMRYRWVAQGGPKSALIRVVGSELTLWQLLDWLRYEVRIVTDLGQPAWWGYINKVSITSGNMSVGVSLESMANNIAVIWSNDSDGGTTEWEEDTNRQGVGVGAAQISDCRLYAGGIRRRLCTDRLRRVDGFFRVDLLRP